MLAEQDKVDSSAHEVVVVPAQRSIVPWLVVGVLLLLVGALASYVMLGGGSTPTPAPANSVEPAPVKPAPEPPPAPEPEIPKIRITTAPPGAEVLNGDEPVCVTPCTLPGEHFELPVTLSLRLRGHLTESYELAGTGNHQVRLQRKPVVPARRPVPVRSRPAAPRPAVPRPVSPRSGPIVPTPEPPPAPAPKEPDLGFDTVEEIKDPFAD